MILYHGTTLEIKKPKIVRSEIGRDFGFAFYTTDIREQAERWARRRAKIFSLRDKKNYQPVVNVYEWNCSADLAVKKFEETSLDWLEMILNCRSNADYHHSFDIVMGKIANDNVGETVSYVLKGIMRKEDAVERLKFEKINNQIAFCTEAALAGLSFVKSYIAEAK